MRVQWTILDGDKVEDFVSQLVLLRNSSVPGNRMRPSSGDRGIDVILRPRNGGVHVFQIKKFAVNLTASHKNQIADSLQTFIDNRGTNEVVSRWSLTLPLDHTPENMDWFQKLTSTAPFECEWIGRTTLDAWAAENPNLVNCHFDGSDTLKEMVTNLLALGSPVQGNVATTRVKAVSDRFSTLGNALDDLDPYYKYVLEYITEGALGPDRVTPRLGPPGTVLSRVQRISDKGEYLYVHVLPRCQASLELSPIGGVVAFCLDSKSVDAQSLRDFHTYGQPFYDVPGSIHEASGPPLTVDSGPVSFSLYPKPNQVTLPLELQLLVDGIAIYATNLTDVLLTGSPRTDGGNWMKGEVAASTIGVQMKLGYDKEQSELKVQINDLSGRVPAECRELLTFFNMLDKASQLQVVIAGTSNPVSPPWDIAEIAFPPKQVSSISSVITNFVRIQAYTLLRIVLPQTWTPSDEKEWDLAVRLLDGETVTTNWDSMKVNLHDPATVPEETFSGMAVTFYLPFEIRVGDQTVQTGKVAQYHCPRARLASKDGQLMLDNERKATAWPLEEERMQIRIVEDGGSDTIQSMTQLGESKNEHNE